MHTLLRLARMSILFVLCALYDDQQTYMAGLTQFILDVDANRF